MIDEYIAEHAEENPVAATSLGIDGHDDRLGTYSSDDFERRVKTAEMWLDRFTSLTDEDLPDLDDRIDRDLVASVCRGQLASADWMVWRRDPAVYVSPCMSGLFSLFLNPQHPEPELAAFAVARLQEVPGVLAAARENLTPELASPLFVQRAAASVRAGVAYFREMVPAEVSDAALRASVAEAGDEAAAALEGFASFLDELGAVASGDYAIGEERYSRLLQEREMLGYGASGLRDRGQAAYDEISEQMSSLASSISGSGGSGDWRTLVEILNQDHPSSPEAMLAAYAECTERSRQFLIDTGIVTMPEGEECRVIPSPPFQRPILAVASYGRPPAFKDSLLGHFFVPFPPDGTPAEEVQKRLQTNSYNIIPAITVHEAYPGHHWHLTTVQLNPRPIRRVLGTPYFAEGWALYAELLMRESGFFTDDRHALLQLDTRIFRAARIVVDTSLHIGDMTFEEAVSFMTTKASLSEPTARAEVGRYCTWPTQAASYLTGSLEIERIRERFFAARLGDVRAFNDRIAGSGYLPIRLAEQAVMGAAA